VSLLRHLPHSNPSAVSDRETTCILRPRINVQARNYPACTNCANCGNSGGERKVSFRNFRIFRSSLLEQWIDFPSALRTTTTRDSWFQLPQDMSYGKTLYNAFSLLRITALAQSISPNAFDRYFCLARINDPERGIAFVGLLLGESNPPHCC